MTSDQDNFEQTQTSPSGVANGAATGLSSESLRQLFILLGIILLLALIVWWQSPLLLELFRDQQRLSQFVEELGWFGPLALIILNTLQIVIAPIPGYFVQAAAGYLYGPFWGGVWATCGLLSGSMLAMGLTRRFGRPFVVALIGSYRLTKWEATTHSTNLLIWFLLLLAPIGDAPYFLAGLSQVSYYRIILATFIVRTPTVFAWAAIGAGVVVLEWWQLVLIFALLGVALVLFLRYQQQLMDWIDRSVRGQLQRKQNIIKREGIE